MIIIGSNMIIIHNGQQNSYQSITAYNSMKCTKGLIMAVGGAVNKDFRVK